VPRISIRRAHNLPRARAIEAVDAVAARLSDEYAVQLRWEGTTLHFDRTGLSGTLEVGVTELTIDVQLGIIMGALRGSIASAIERHLDEHFAGKPRPAGRRGK
jgi:putative polyhydroxyalkanoate system protein